MSTKEKIIGIVLVLIIITVNYLSSESELKKEGSINKNKYETICKVYKIDIGRGFRDADYFYYFEG